MRFRDMLPFSGRSVATEVRAQSSGGDVFDLNDPRIAELLRSGSMTASGASVTADNALATAAVFRSVTIICGAVSSMPLHLMKEDAEDERIKTKAKGHPLFKVLYIRPNKWQTSVEWRAMLQAHVLLRGNGYCYKVKGYDGNVRELIPLHPDRVDVKQLEDLSLVYEFTRADGRRQLFAQDDIFHLRDLSTDGITGLSRIALMREAVGLAKATEKFGARVFKNDASIGVVFKMPDGKRLSDPAYARLKQSIDEEWTGADKAHKAVLLEEGLTPDRLGMTSGDAQFLETRQFQAGEIAMFFGVPPHLIGDTKSTTNWGTGIEQSNIGFLQFTILPWISMWEQSIVRDIILEADNDNYFPKFNVSSLLRASMNDQGTYFSKALGAGGSPAWLTPNEVRGYIDLNPKEGGDELPQPTAIAKQNSLGNAA